MASKYLIELILRTKKEGTAGKEVEKELSGVGKAAKKAGGMFQGIKDNWKALAALGVGVAGAAMAVKKAMEMGREGAAILQTGESFEFLMEKVGAMPGLFDQLQSASRNTVDDMQLMSSTTTLLAGTQGELATELANSTPKLMEIAKAANKLNPSLGTTTFLYESLATGIKRAQPLILDNLGLTIKVGEANKQYAKSIGKTVEELSAEETQLALLNAALEAGDVMIDQVGGTTEAMTDSFDQATAALKNTTDQLKTQLVPVTAAAAAELSRFLTVVSGELPQALVDVTEGSRKAGASLKQMAEDAQEAKAMTIYGGTEQKEAKLFWFDMTKAVKLTGEEFVALGLAAGSTWPEIMAAAEAVGTDLDIDDWEQYYLTMLNVDNAVEPWVERQQEAAAAAKLTAAEIVALDGSMVGLAQAVQGGVVALTEEGEVLDVVAEREKEAEQAAKDLAKAQEALADAVDYARAAFEGFYSTLSSGLISLRDLDKAQQQSAQDYKDALADLDSSAGASYASIRKKFEASLPDKTTVKDRLDMAGDAWDEWGLRLNDIMEHGIASPWFDVLQEMGFAKPPDMGIEEWASGLRDAFYAGDLTGLINEDTKAWQDHAAGVAASQAEETAAVRQGTADRKAVLEQARQEQLAAEKEAQTEATIMMALNLAEQSDMLAEWSAERFGPDLSGIGDTAVEVFDLLKSGQIEVDANLQALLQNFTAGIQQQLSETGAAAEANQAAMEALVSTDYAAQIADQQAALATALDVTEMLPAEDVETAMAAIGTAIEDNLPVEPFDGLLDNSGEVFGTIITNAADMAGEVIGSLETIVNDGSTPVTEAIAAEWYGNSLFPDMVSEGASMESSIISNFSNIGTESTAMAAVVVASLNAMKAAADGVITSFSAVVSGLKKSAAATNLFKRRVSALNAELKKMKALLENMPSTTDSPPPAAVGLEMTAAAAALLAHVVGGRLSNALIGATEDMGDLMSAASKLSSIGGSFAKMFTEARLDPLEDQMDLIDKQAESLDKQIKWYEGLGTNAALIEAVRLAEEQVSLEEERATLAAEYAAQQERILRLQEQQDRLDFLGEQVKLLDLISKYELDPAQILKGLKLGMDVSTEDMIAAMTTALERITNNLNQQLVGFQHGGQFTVQGPGGVDNVPVFFRASAGETVTVTPSGQPAPEQGGGQPIIVNNYISPSIYSRMDAAEFEARVLGVVNQGLRI